MLNLSFSINFPDMKIPDDSTQDTALMCNSSLVTYNCMHGLNYE